MEELRANFYINDGVLSVVEYLEDGTEQDEYFGEVNEIFVEYLKSQYEINGFTVETYRD